MSKKDRISRHKWNCREKNFYKALKRCKKTKSKLSNAVDVQSGGSYKKYSSKDEFN